MSTSTTLTIRIDEELKSALERAAELDDRSVTEFVVRAIKTRMAPQCPSCGRADTPMTLPAGLTPAMDSFLEEVKKGSGGRIPVVLTTLDGTQRFSFRGIVRFWNEVNHGVILLEIGETSIPIPIPRGLITGWSFDQDGRHHQTYLALGYANGNASIEHAVAGMGTRHRR